MTVYRPKKWKLVSQPKKWLWGLLPLAALGMGAWAISSPSLETELANAAGAELKSGGLDWASISMDGRDAVLNGVAPGDDAVSKAVELVAGTHGVRRVDFAKVSIAPPVVLNLPTVNTVAGKSTKPEISGTWPESVATTLGVSVDGQDFKLGSDAALTSDGSGNWKLMPPSALAEGEHDVSVMITDGKKASAADNTSAEILVDTTAPTAPIVTGLVNDTAQPTISGSYDKDAANLAVTAAGDTYILGEDDELSSDGAGKWSLTLPGKLAPGSYDVWVMSKDQFGNASSVRGRDAVSVSEPPAPQPPAAPTVNVTEGFSATPSVTGTWPEGDGNKLKVNLDGKSYGLGSDKELTSDGSGNWSLMPATGLADGDYTAVATVTNSAGLTTNSNAGQLAVLTAAPAVPSVDPVVGFGNKPTVTGTWPEKNGNALSVAMAGKIYQLGADDALSSDGAGKWSLIPGAPLADGAYDAVATVTNTAGRSADSNTGKISVLTMPPAAPSVADVAGYSSKPTVSGTWPEKDGNSLSVALAGKTYQLGKDDTLSSDGSGNWSLTPEAGLEDGKFDAIAKATNVAGLTANSNTGQLTVLTAAPAVPSIDPVIGFGNKPTVTGTWPEGNGNSLSVAMAGKTYQLGKDGALSSNGAGKWSLMPETTLSDGGYDAVATVTNPAGITALSDSTKIAVLTASPVAPTVAKTSGFENLPTLTGTWPESGGNSLSVAVAGKTYLLGSDSELSSDGSGNWSLIPSSALPEGIFDVSATTRNVAGLAANDKTTDETQVDTTPPARPGVATLASREGRPTITGTWDESDAKTLSVGVGGKAYDLSEDGALTSDGKGNWSLKPDADLNDGAYEVAAAATDAAGNVSRDNSSSEVIIDTTAPAAPTIVAQITRERQPLVAGTWRADEASALSVSIGSDTYTTDQSDALKIVGDNWTLNVPGRLEDGAYDVLATAEDSVGNSASDTSEGELVVDATPPAVPQVNTYKSAFVQPLLTGTFPEKDIEQMTVSFGDETFELGTAAGPVSDGNGTWAVTTEKEYAPGIYDVSVVVTDAAGNRRSDATTNEIEVLAPPPVKISKVEPEPVAEPELAPKAVVVDCQKLFDELLAKDSINFRTGRAGVDKTSAELISKLVEVAKQCPDANIEIAGHTDSRGSATSNQRLSESRAVAVREALVIKGAPATNITAVGYGESKPIADNSTRAGRAENRRTVFTVKP